MGKISKNGRSNNRDRFFAVPHYILNTPAWKQLSVSARATWLEFGRVHDGLNMTVPLRQSASWSHLGSWGLQELSQTLSSPDE